MRQKFVFTTAIAVCLSLALVPAFANERDVDRYGDRSKSGKGVTANGGVTIEYSIDTHGLAGAPFYSGTTSSTNNRAASILAAAEKADDATAVRLLQQLTMMDLQSSDQTDRILSSAFEMLAGFYSEAPSKQVMNLGMALQYASDADRRSTLEGQIAALGGDSFSLAFNNNGINSYAQRDPGSDDTCAGSVPVSLPHSEVMSITPSGDHNWRSFDLVGAPQDGAFMRIQTISDGAPFTDDTDLTLWDGCPGEGGTLLAFNDDALGDFTSLILSDCLGPGTYQVEVGGFFDISTPDNFTLEIEVDATCIVPTADSYEPDDENSQAADIGFPTPTSGNGWGRANKEIQDRSMVPRGDFDNARIELNQSSLVRMGTADQFATFFNGFTGAQDPLGRDTIMHLMYENEPDYGGRCNDQDTGFLPICQTDADCPPPGNPIPGFPLCIPIQAFNIGIYAENPIITNDDRAPGDFGSEIETCLPRTGPGGGSLTLQQNGGDFVVRVNPWHPSAPSGDPFDPNLTYVDPFSYQLEVKNLVGCLYEQEPNDDCCEPYDSRGPALPYEIGTTVSGMWDFSVANPYRDLDHYRFDIDETTDLLFSTDAPDPLDSDTTIDIIVGPADNGFFFFAYQCPSPCDGGNGRLSEYILTLPPATQLLGNVEVEAHYVARVASDFVSENWPYEFSISVATPPVIEVEPNDTEADAQPVGVNDTVLGALSVECDYDTFSFDIGEDTLVTIEQGIAGSGVLDDGAIQVTDCNGNVLNGGCDDDSGPGFLSLISGCLPAGTYCAQLRAFDGTVTGDYQLAFSGAPGCVADDPPLMTGDGAYTCTDWDTCP